MNEIIGGVMLGLLFLGLGWLTASFIGLKKASILWGVILLTTLWFVAAAVLITGGN